MLPLSANSDYKDLENHSTPNPFYDLNGDDFSNKCEIYGADALDQAIEMVLVTEPYERVFNLQFSSPLYTILFENMNNIEDLISTVFDAIEYWVPVKIYRDKAEITKDKYNNTIKFKIPYISNDGRIASTFSRVIGR